MAKNMKKNEKGLYYKNLVVGKKPDGSYIRKYIYGKTQRELESKVAAVTKQINDGIMVWQNDMTFAELTDIWLNQYNPVASERWKYRMQSLLNCHLLPSIGQMKVRDLRQIHLQAIISDKAKNGYATSMMKKIKQTAERIMRVAIDSDLIAKNPFSGVKVPVIEAEGRRALTPEEISLITNNWKGTLFGHGAMIMLYAGLRQGEVLALNWEDIDFEDRIIHVTKAREVLKNQATIKKPKTKAGYRDVPIPDILYNVLISVKKPKGLVCPDTKGRLMSGAAYKSAWESFLNHLNIKAGGQKACGPKHPHIQVIDRITAHMLRHTYATMLFDAGVDVKSAQKFLGHADIEVTLSIYTHLSKFKEEKAISSLNEHLSSFVS